MESDWHYNVFEKENRVVQLLEAEKCIDCRFLVGCATPHQKIIAAHKLILAMASPVFESMFDGQHAEKDDPIVVSDVQPDAFEAMLAYIYYDRINISTFDEACELSYVAKKYKLPFFFEECIRFLKSALSPDNAGQAFEFAKVYDEPHLKQTSMMLITKSTQAGLTTPQLYCVRSVKHRFNYHNKKASRCSFTFEVDTDIWITGLEVPTQILLGVRKNSSIYSTCYMESLYAHVQDTEGSRLSYAHRSIRVSYDSTVEITLNQPAYIRRNKIYKMVVSFNTIGLYPMYETGKNIECKPVKFRFKVDESSKSVRDGLIRSIVFLPVLTQQ